MRSREVWQDIECVAAMVKRRGVGSANPEGLGADRLRLSWNGMFADLARTGITPAALDHLLALAEVQDIAQRRADLFRGTSPGGLPARCRPMVAFRRPFGTSALLDGEDHALQIDETRRWPESLASAIRLGDLRGATGACFSNVIQLGTAAAGCGPALAAQALGGRDGMPAVHFVSEEEGAALHTLLARLEPAETLVILATGNLIAPAYAALARMLVGWFTATLGAEAAARHLAAVTSDVSSALALGIPAERIISAPERLMADLSVWSPVNLGLMIALGPEMLEELRRGAHEMDEHFRSAPADRNLPLMLALADVWLEDGLGALPVAPASYDPALPGWSRWAAPPARAAARRAHASSTRPGDAPPVLEAFEAVVAALPASEEWADYLLVRTAEALAEVRLRSAGIDAQRMMTSFRALGLSVEEARERVERLSRATEEPSIILGYRRLDAPMLGRLMALTELRRFAAAAIRAEGTVPAERPGRISALAAEPVLDVLSGRPAFGIEPGTRGVLRLLMAERGEVPGFLVMEPSGNVVSMPRLAGIRRRGGEPAGEASVSPLHQPTGA